MSILTRAITRRDFLKRTATGVGGVVLAKYLGSGTSFAQPTADMSKVVVVKHDEATDGVKLINADNVQDMVDESIKQLTDQPSIADAWASLLPDFRKEHVVAIKVNCLEPSLPTHPQVVDAVITGLTAAGVPENNIIIYDRTNNELIAAGYEHNAGDTGVRCFGTDEEGWKTDRNNPTTIIGRRTWLSTILTRCDHLINAPVLKWHEFGIPTLSLKNHFGSITSPELLHGDFHSAIPTLNSLGVIRDKTRLIVTDALFGCWSKNSRPPNFAPNSLIVSRDPVAADTIGGEILKEARVNNGQGNPKNIIYIEKAVEMGLGTCDPEKIDLLEIKMEEFEEEIEEIVEENVGKAVKPANSYITQWGRVKQ